MNSHWADEALRRAVALGLLQGDPDGSLRPEDPIKRGEAAVLALRVYDRTLDVPQDIIPEVERAVVMIVNERTGALGSGSSIGGGYILTNAHVVLNQDGTHEAMYGIHWSTGLPSYAMGPLVWCEPTRDLAIIRADIGENRLQLPRLQLAQTKPRVGEPLTIIGSPVGIIGTVTHGIVSKTDWGLSYNVGGHRAVFEQIIQTDAAINPGNSGGAALNRRGELAGVPSAKLVHLALEGLGFCIGIDTIRTVLKDPGFLGVPVFRRPDYEGLGGGFGVSIQTHHMPLHNVDTIVVHHTGDEDRNGAPVHRDTTAMEIHRYHRAKSPPWAAIGYHFVIRWDGLIEVGRSIYTRGAHAGAAVNPRSWGVVFSGNFNAAYPTSKQMASWRWLRDYLLGVKRVTISIHKQHGDTTCPGSRLRLSDLVA